MSDYKFKPYPEFLEASKVVKDLFNVNMSQFVKKAMRKHRKTNFEYKMIDKKIEQSKTALTIRDFKDVDSTVMQSICVQYAKDQIGIK